MKITAAVTPAPHTPFVLQEVELDPPQRGEVLVRIVGAGICHSDLVGTAGLLPVPMPAVFGHEGAGVVEMVGPSVSKVVPGDKVVITFSWCGNCPQCEKSAPAYCHSMASLNFTGLRADGSTPMRNSDGNISAHFFGQSSFATYALATERNVVKVLEGVPLEFAGPLGCGIQTGAGAVMRSMACHQGSTLVVTGGGTVGLSAVMAAKLQECSSIIVIEPSAQRRELAKALGATHVIAPESATDVAAAVRAICPSGVDYVLDTSGIPAVIAAVPRMLAPRGTFGFVGVPPANATDLGLPGTLREAMRAGFTYRGIIEGDSNPDEFIPELMSLYLDGRFPFDKLITTYPFADINLAVEEQQRGLCVKPVLLP